MLNRILVPTDFTPVGLNALKVAVQLAKKTKSKIDLMHIVELPVSVNLSEEGLEESINADLKDRFALQLIKSSNSRLDSIKDTFREDGIEINIRSKVDGLPDRVAELITREDYDLIVVGGDTATEFFEFLKKSHPERIVELARCPVLVINKEMEKFDINKVVLPTSLENSIVKSIDQIRGFISFIQADLRLLYVNTPAGFKSTKEISELAQEYKELHGLEEIGLEVYNDHSAKKGITNYSEQNSIDLILLTSRHSKKIFSVFKGDITEYLVNHCPFPVLTFNVRNEK